MNLPTLCKNSRLIEAAESVDVAPLSVTALGGLCPDDWGRARYAGAFGVAGIGASG